MGYNLQRAHYQNGAQEQGNEERWKWSRSRKGDWQPSDWSRQERAVCGWALPCLAEAQDVLMEVRSSSSVDSWVRASGRSVEVCMVPPKLGMGFSVGMGPFGWFGAQFEK